MHIGSKSGENREQFGSNADARREQIGSKSGAMREQCGSKSGAIREQFGSNSEAMWEYTGVHGLRGQRLREEIRAPQTYPPSHLAQSFAFREGL